MPLLATGLAKILIPGAVVDARVQSVVSVVRIEACFIIDTEVHFVLWLTRFSFDFEILLETGHVAQQSRPISPPSK